MEETIMMEEIIYSAVLPHVIASNVDHSLSPFSFSVRVDTAQEALAIWSDLTARPSHQFNIVDQDNQTIATYDTRIFRAAQMQPYEGGIYLTAMFAPDIHEEFATLSEKYRQVLNEFSEWQPDRNYAEGDKVIHEEHLYASKAAHTSQAGMTPNVIPAIWQNLTDPELRWTVGVYYESGMQVMYGDDRYVCLVSHRAEANTEPPMHPSHWQPEEDTWTDEAF